MCCRYGYEPGLIDDFDIETGNIETGVKDYPRTDVYPSDPAVIMTSDFRKQNLCVRIMPWGFPQRDNKLLINARAETALEKKTFADSIQRRRCVIPASQFYEWDRDKVKNTFYLPERTPVYMAGFYNLFGSADHFIILTTAANGSMKEVHERMPLILNKDEAENWLFDDSRIKDLLMIIPPILERESDYEQLSFF